MSGSCCGRLGRSTLISAQVAAVRVRRRDAVRQSVLLGYRRHLLVPHRQPVLVLVLSLVLGPVSTGYRSAKCTDELLVLYEQGTRSTDFKIHFKLSTVRVLAFVHVLSLVLGPVSTDYRSAKCTDELLVLYKRETGSTDTKY